MMIRRTWILTSAGRLILMISLVTFVLMAQAANQPLDADTVRQALQDVGYDPPGLNVVVELGVVTLSGSIPEIDRRNIIEVVHTVEGVSEVKDQLETTD